MTATYSRTTAQCGPECEIARARAQISTRRCGSRVSDDMMFYYSQTGTLDSHGINRTSVCPTKLLRSRHGIGTKSILEDLQKHMDIFWYPVYLADTPHAWIPSHRHGYYKNVFFVIIPHWVMPGSVGMCREECER